MEAKRLSRFSNVSSHGRHRTTRRFWRKCKGSARSQMGNCQTFSIRSAAADRTPLESLRLGLPTYTGDLNPVAVLIQRAMLETPSKFANRAPVSADARSPQQSGTAREGWRPMSKPTEGSCNRPLVRGSASTTRTPRWTTGARPDAGWPGSGPRTVASPRSLVARPRAAGAFVGCPTKPGKPVIWVEPIIDHANQTISYRIRTGGEPTPPSVEHEETACASRLVPLCQGSTSSRRRTQRSGQTLIAVVAEGPYGPHVYLSPGPYFAR